MLLDLWPHVDDAFFAVPCPHSDGPELALDGIFEGVAVVCVIPLPVEGALAGDAPPPMPLLAVAGEPAPAIQVESDGAAPLQQVDASIEVC